MHGTNIPGRARKRQGDIIMDATFTQDIQYQVGYLFDYYHTTPENRLKLEGFDPETDENPTPVDLKLIAHSKKTYDKDEVTMHIQFRPGYKCSVEYYESDFVKRYNARFPVGLYVWLKGEDDIYRRWLVVATADRDENQFPTWEVLRCDEVFRWIKDGKYYEYPGASRSQNSYNSGLWLDFKFQQPEDQTKFCLPLNRDTEHLYYNTYLVIDANVLTEPRVWQISKINRSVSKGIAVFTATQELANQHTLRADYDADGNVVAWWADWEQSEVPPVPASKDDIVNIHSEIICSGKPQIRIGGSPKTFTVIYYDEFDHEITDHEAGSWSLWFDDERVPNALVQYYELDDNKKLKFKFLGDDSYIGKILTVKSSSEDTSTSLQIEILAL